VVQLLINVDVDDLERAIEFYRSALGLTLKRRLSTTPLRRWSGLHRRSISWRSQPGVQPQ
jgi:catechol 2,3-dioxygenase-like lactoylglutathione lyase family enzyme